MLSLNLGRLRNWKITNIALVLVIILGIILRFYKLGAQSFWVDEIASINYAKRGYYGEGHPPVSFIILLYFIETFGENEFIARLPSCLFGIATIPVVYLFGRQLFSEKEGLVASFIISISPWHIRWSQEARMYTELTFFTILALYFFYHAIYKENLTFYVFSAMSMTLAYYTHFFAIFIPVILVIWLISLRFFDKTRPHINFGQLLIFFEFFFVLCAPSFFSVIPEVIAGKLGEVISGVGGAMWGEPTITQFISKFFITELRPILPVFSILGAILIVLKKNKASFLLLILYEAIPFLTLSLLVPRMNIVVRYLLFTLPAYALLTSILLVEIVKKIKNEIAKRFHGKTLKDIQINIALSIGILLIIIFSMDTISKLSFYYEYGEHPDWRSACLFVRSRIEPNDMVVSTAVSPVDYYLEHFVDYELSETHFDKTKNSKRRIWLFIDEWRINGIDPDHEFQDWLTSHCKIIHQVRLIEIYLFDPQEFN